ncbi:centrosomal protein of 126 kDa isoform X2 [Hemicordylus capensis]|uniref:centrosomal protein of 126 kDa isoform X2 n=1 Tax=Hemicordylus capensis TaxID=884348 RepID=UPI0023047653|nr:centrosomal protein of 126 kDa isoform X2 [Hemicordylus capensis]
MERGGGGSSSSSGILSGGTHYSSFARVGAGGSSPGEGGGKTFSAWEATSAAEAGGAEIPVNANPCWRRESAPHSRGQGRLILNAFVPCTNLKILLERDLSKERHELLKDQRQFRNRARKHFVETNKRRRALEEKWKEDEEKEKKFRDQILLQRKLKHQEATEKFQRGHIPSSQRTRVQRKPGSKLDEALNQIQITGLHLPSSKANNRTISRPSSAIRNGPFYWKQNSSKTGCDRITQENIRAKPDSNQLKVQQNLDEMQQQLPEQHFSSLQEFHQEVNEIARPESVSSVDSLEAGEPNESYATLSEASSLSAPLDSSIHNSQGLQTRNKSLSDETDMTISKNQHVNNWLKNLNTSNFQATSPFRDILIKYNVIPSGEDACSSDQKSSVPSISEQREAERCSSENNLTFVQDKEDKSSLLNHTSLGTIGTEDPLATDKPVLRINKTWSTPDSSSVALVQEENSELPQDRTPLAQACGQTAASPVDMPTRQWSSAATYNYNNSLLVDCMQKGRDAHAARCTEDIDCITGAHPETSCSHINDEAPVLEEPNKDSLEKQKGNKEEKTTEVLITVPHEDFTANFSDLDLQENYNTNESKGVKLPKSILKKESKYEPSPFRAVVVNRGIRFGNLPMSSVIDSIELAKTKGKEADIQKNSKKLRWFDEINRVVKVNDDGKCLEESATEIPQAQLQSPGLQIKATTSRTNLESTPSHTVNSLVPENHQENSQTSATPASAEGSEEDSGDLFVSSGYHVAKQAWMAPRGEEIKPPPYYPDLKNPKNNARRGRTKMIRRPKSAKVQSTFTPKNRRGAIVRPQSASEATRVMKTQGKIMMPHPPCKPIPGKKPDENPADTVYQSVNVCKLHADTENSHFLNGRHPLLEGQDLSKDTIGDPSPPNIARHSHMVTMRPSYSIFTYEPLTKTKCITNTAQAVVPGNSFSRRSALYSENGLCPDRTPTDEEIAVLWQGVHRALAQKDGAAGDSQHSATHYINSNSGDLQPTRSNVSHITIDGGNLMSSIKTGVRVNGFFPPQSTTAVAMARRKHCNESGENKRKALLEQRRQMAATAGWKPTSIGQNMVKSMKLAPCHCTHEPVQSMGGMSNSDEVSDSTSQFLQAENLKNMTATEGEILTGSDTGQLYKNTVVLNRTQRQGMSALSLEEHRVLQSLERINQRLQNVQGTINKNPSSTSILQTISPLVTSPSYVDITSPLQKYRSISAETRALMQRRY